MKTLILPGLVIGPLLGVGAAFAAPAADTTMLVATVSAVSATLGAIGRSFFDAKKTDRQKDSDDIKTLVGALIDQNGQRHASQDHFIEKLLTEQAHTTQALDALRRQREQDRSQAQADLAAANAKHHQCELECAGLKGRVALMEREIQVLKVAEKTAPTVLLVPKGDENAQTT